jgi:hypothetical protein
MCQCTSCIQLTLLSSSSIVSTPHHPIGVDSIRAHWVRGDGIMIGVQLKLLIAQPDVSQTSEGMPRSGQAHSRTVGTCSTCLQYVGSPAARTTCTAVECVCCMEVGRPPAVSETATKSYRCGNSSSLRLPCKGRGTHSEECRLL